MPFPPLVLAANRRIGRRVLIMFQDAGWHPVAVLVPEGERAECVEEMKALLPGVPTFAGQTFKTEESLELIRTLRPDYLLSAHFPHLIPPALLSIPRIGALNLHPAYLPYNRGWHTPSWAIAEDTPYGATLHWLDAGVDTGDIALQERLEIGPGDTAHGLYQRVLELEVALITQALPLMRDFKLPRVPQPAGGTSHTKRDLAAIQRLDLSESRSVGETIRRLRALTTNQLAEAAYFEIDGRRFRVRVEITEEPEGGS